MTKSLCYLPRSVQLHQFASTFFLLHRFTLQSILLHFAGPNLFICSKRERERATARKNSVRKREFVFGLRHPKSFVNTWLTNGEWSKKKSVNNNDDDDAKKNRLKADSMFWPMIMFGHNNERNPIDPIKNRFPVDETASVLSLLLTHAKSFLFRCLRVRMRCSCEHSASVHTCIYVWLCSACLDWVATRAPDHIIILLFDWNLMVDFKEGPSSWMESIEVQKRPHRTQFIPFFPHFVSFLVRLNQKFSCCMNVSFTIISNLIRVERTSKVKIANKFRWVCCVRMCLFLHPVYIWFPFFFVALSTVC